jgi:hypothetical protein
MCGSGSSWCLWCLCGAEIGLDLRQRAGVRVSPNRDAFNYSHLTSHAAVGSVGEPHAGMIFIGQIPSSRIMEPVAENGGCSVLVSSVVKDHWDSVFRFGQ